MRNIPVVSAGSIARACQQPARCRARQVDGSPVIASRAASPFRWTVGRRGRHGGAVSLPTALSLLLIAATPPGPGAARAAYTRSIAVPPAAAAQRPLVVLDAGHGGPDPGAVNAATELREKDVTLQIAHAIRDALLATGRVRVALTRDDDRYIPLRDRFGIARRMKADLFLSIHCDSAANGAPAGATAYTLSDVASDKEAARLAARENRSDAIAGVPLDRDAGLSSILIDLTLRETMDASAGFARLLGREARALIPTRSEFHRTASLLVLKAPDMPSLLFETGYLSSARDAAFLASAAGRARIAESVKRAVAVYFARRASPR
jgi:N-acetylmuramoyl-L-alanine amidase